MEFKFHDVDNVKPPPTMSHSPSPATYLPDPSLQMDGGFSSFRPPLIGEEALRRELEKEVIRREILRRRELEEEVRRELAMERELGISTQRPLNIHGLGPQWSNSTVINSVVVAQMGLPSSQPSMVLPPTAINPSPEISNNNKDNVIVLDRPDPDLFYAKRKATTLLNSETGPSTFDLKKKLKQDWSCELCGIKATSESGLNAHLNGKKHKIKKAGQNRKTCKSNTKSEKIVHEANDTVDTSMVQKSIIESKSEEQLVDTMIDNDVSATKFKNEDTATEEAEKMNVLTEEKKVERL
ncbi:uncharacterized protein LOC131632097 [Vicia villosa]|uniref:uncharacterized protein LOC131632097 n=1 Tax=Vicia villosa TaxID=3911 RepID=UPI00273B592B|nr:uncharacterized protein LOC131632097 [Vicia villosa]